MSTEVVAPQKHGRFEGQDGKPLSREEMLEPFPDGSVTRDIKEFTNGQGGFDEGKIYRFCFGKAADIDANGEGQDARQVQWIIAGDTIRIYPYRVREQFYRQFPEVSSRTEILVPDYREIMRAEGYRIRPITPIELRLFNAIHKGQDKTGPLGIPWSRLIDPEGEYRLRIAQRSIHETKSWPVARSLMRKLRLEAQGWFDRHETSYDYLSIFDVGTGAGTTAVAAREDITGLVPTRVTTIERDFRIADYALENSRILGIQGITHIVGNAVDYMRLLEPNGPQMNGWRFGAIFFDVPWRAAHASADIWVKELRDLYLISEEGRWRLTDYTIRDALEARKHRSDVLRENVLDPEYALLNGEELVKLAFENGIAPIVAFHVPANLERKSVRDSAVRIEADALMIRHRGYDGERRLEEVELTFLVPDDSKHLQYREESINFGRL